MSPALTDEQRDGLACVRCGADLEAVSSVPVGVVDGGQVFACSSHDADDAAVQPETTKRIKLFS